ncbi:hypothetical protein L1887_57956 [Cichorium endivia]|nr:hypothetical protein L1887_57956 [Cichorium endivia]
MQAEGTNPILRTPKSINDLFQPQDSAATLEEHEEQEEVQEGMGTPRARTPSTLSLPVEPVEPVAVPSEVEQGFYAFLHLGTDGAQHRAHVPAHCHARSCRTCLRAVPPNLGTRSRRRRGTRSPTERTHPPHHPHRKRQTTRQVLVLDMLLIHTTSIRKRKQKDFKDQESKLHRVLASAVGVCSGVVGEEVDVAGWGWTHSACGEAELGLVEHLGEHLLLALAGEHECEAVSMVEHGVGEGDALGGRFGGCPQSGPPSGPCSLSSSWPGKSEHLIGQGLASGAKKAEERVGDSAAVAFEVRARVRVMEDCGELRRLQQMALDEDRRQDAAAKGRECAVGAVCHPSLRAGRRSIWRAIPDAPPLSPSLSPVETRWRHIRTAAQRDFPHVCGCGGNCLAISPSRLCAPGPKIEITRHPSIFDILAIFGANKRRPWPRLGGRHPVRVWCIDPPIEQLPVTETPK